MKPINVNPGARFNKLVVINEIKSHIQPSGLKVRLFECLCDCGNKTIVNLSNLRRNHIKSCGCLNSELSRKRRQTHKKSKSTEYIIWSSMIGRCNNKNNKDYGGNNIAVCKEWLDFERFFKDMGERPSKNHSIDRLDNTLGYSPDNCRWATRIEQNNNKQTNIVITVNGKTQTASQWAEELNIPASRLYHRKKMGWKDIDIIFKPRRIWGKEVRNYE